MRKRSLIITFSVVISYLLFAGITLAAGTGGVGGPPGGDPTVDGAPPQICGLLEIVAKMIRIIAPAAGIGFFVMLVYAGYQYLFSFGSPGGAGKARSAMLTALIGVIVLVLIYGLFKSLELVTGINLLNYNPGTTCI